MASVQTAPKRTFARLNSHHELKSRLEIINESAKRARGALLLCILASGAMFLCLWNTYASWDRDFAFLDPKHDFNMFKGDGALYRRIGPKPEQVQPEKILEAVNNRTPLFKKDAPKKDADKKNANKDAYKEYDSDSILSEAWQSHSKRLPTDLQQQQMRSWIDTQTISVGLLGIRISVSDFAIVGSIALFLCNYYLLVCTRRENHEIGYLFQDIVCGGNLRTFGYHAFATVSALMVFNLTGSHSLGGGTDQRIRSLKTPNRKPHILPKILGIRLVSRTLDFLPPATVAATIVADFGWTHGWHLMEDLFFISPFRPPQDSPWHGFTPAEMHYFWGAEIFATVIAVCLVLMSISIFRYEQATRMLLEEVYNGLAKLGLQSRWVGSVNLTRQYPQKTVKLNKNVKLRISCDGPPNSGQIEIDIDGVRWTSGDVAALAPGGSTEVRGRKVLLRLPKEQTRSSTGTYEEIEEEGYS